MVTGHVLLAGGTLPSVRRPAGGGRARGRARGCAWAGRWRGVGSAIDTPAPGRASAPPGQRGRISARKACCAGTQNTSHTVTPRPAPLAAPCRPPHANTHIRASGRCQLESAEPGGKFQTGRHVMYPPVSIPSLPALISSSRATWFVHRLALSPPWDQCGIKTMH